MNKKSSQYLKILFFAISPLITLIIIFPISAAATIGYIYPSEANLSLLNAADGDDKSKVEKLISEGADVNFVGGLYGASALYNAAKKGNKEIVKLLIESGADVNKVTGLGGLKRTALFGSIGGLSHTGHKDVVQLLLNSKADVNVTDLFGLTPLMWAASNSNKDIVKILIDAGANVNAIDNRIESTPLINAVRSGNKDIVRLLLNAGADIEQKVSDEYRKKKNAMQFARQGNKQELVKMLEEEPARRKAVIEKWNMQMLKEIGSATNLITPLAELTAGYTPIEKYADIPAKDRAVINNILDEVV